ncbi:ATP-binding protein [Bacillus suaedaesalsae]
MSTFLTYVVELETSKFQIEKDLDRLSHESELILNSLSEGVFGLDINGSITFCNPATTNLLNYEEKELIGKTPTSTFLNNEDKSELLLTLIDGKTRSISHESFYSKDGHHFPVEYRANAILEKGRITGGVVTFIDITERRNSEDIILKSEKLSLAGQLAAGIAHEIRNPLTSIKGFLQLIGDGYEKETYIQIMSDELIRIESIVSELLLLAKPQDVNFKPELVGLIITDVISILETQANMNNTQLLLDIQEENLFINCDSNQMKQVFINLVKNSVEALPTGGVVEVGVKVAGNYIEISVKDNGVGIPLEKINQIGQPFYSTKEEGTGLGLMVSFNIIQNHQGTVKVESERNKGTTFTITLPIYEQPEYILI